MTFFAIIITLCGGITAFFFRKGGIYNPIEVPPTPEPVVPPPTIEPKLSWDTPQNAYHALRVMCDDAGLSLEHKNIVCACVYQESQFKNGAVGRNATSTDWGIFQVNDTPGWHIGPGLRFSSVQDVLDHPERAAQWMIQTMKNTGKLQPWASYTSGAYKKWLSPTSPMWALKMV